MAVCKDEGMPGVSTVLGRWISAEPEFATLYARAKLVRLDVMAEEIRELADTCRIGVKIRETDKGTETTTADMVERSKLQVETRKWLLARLAAKTYGERLELAGDKDAPLTITVRRMDRP